MARRVCLIIFKYLLMYNQILYVTKKKLPKKIKKWGRINSKLKKKTTKKKGEKY